MTALAPNARPQPASSMTYLGLAIIMFVLLAAEMFVPFSINQGQQMSWLIVVAAALLGWAGLSLSGKAGFASMWAASVPPAKRFWIPFGLGASLGLAMVLLHQFNPMGVEIQTPFPDSLIVFSLAGLVEELLVHLFLTVVLVWFISGVILKNRGQTAVFWLVAIAIGLLYWALQMSAIVRFFPEKASLTLALQMVLVIGTTITLGAYVFRLGGFLAALSLRYGFYLIWHIIWGGGIGLVRYLL
jgi:hypothetical protein